MSDPIAIDYATARPDLKAVKAAGVIAVLRYLSPGSNPKNLTKAEADAILAEDLGIGNIWESTGDRALSGGSAGHLDGVAAVAEAQAVGQPHGTPLLCNIGDFVATPAQIPVIHDYYHEFRLAAMPYQVGGYGTGFIIDQLSARGAVGLWWQNAMNDDGVLGSVVSPHTSIYQRVAHTITIPGTNPGDWDEDAIVGGPMTVNWWKAAPTPPPVTTMHGVVVYSETLPDLLAKTVTSTDNAASWH